MIIKVDEMYLCALFVVYSLFRINIFNKVNVLPQLKVIDNIMLRDIWQFIMNSKDHVSLLLNEHDSFYVTHSEHFIWISYEVTCSD